jgi:anthranilate synthase component 1
MYYPNQEQFVKLAKKGNLIPVYAEMLSDFETPLSAFMKIDDGNFSYLLESVEGQEKTARFSFLGSNPRLIFKSKGDNIEVIRGSKKHNFRTSSDPLDEIRRLMSDYKFVEVAGLPRFCGGMVGYMGYDLIRFFEPSLNRTKFRNPDDLNVPDSVFMLSSTLIIFDHLQHKIKIVANAHIDDFSPKGNKDSAGRVQDAYRQAIKEIEGVFLKLKKSLPEKKFIRLAPKPMLDKLNLKSNFTKREFETIVRRAKRYIRRGDIIQVVISQRLKIKLKANPLGVYRALRYINPSPYMFFLRFQDAVLTGSSPEVLVSCQARRVRIRPIAGTRPRGKDEAQDKRLAESLYNDPKERAEHLMLVDLGRNDIGRVCKAQTVKVSEFMVLEKYSHVMHLVSEVEGQLRPDKDRFELLKSAFPAGTVTGAPKIRAMEIIDELENIKRGPYAGCVGYFSFSGNMDTCITIRSLLIKKNVAFIQAGAGIVADSKPSTEYRETLNKARAQIKAIQLAH